MITALAMPDVHAGELPQASNSGFQSPEQAVFSDQSLEKQADLYMARKFFKEAAETYSKAIAADPGDARL